jgi:hypothetical protein
LEASEKGKGEIAERANSRGNSFRAPGERKALPAEKWPISGRIGAVCLSLFSSDD